MHSVKKMILEWKTNYQLEARNEKGLSVKFDAPIDHGGEETDRGETHRTAEGGTQHAQFQGGAAFEKYDNQGDGGENRADCAE